MLELQHRLPERMIRRWRCAGLLWLVSFAVGSETTNPRIKVVKPNIRTPFENRNLYYARSSILEDFILACESKFNGEADVDQEDFATFVVGYCTASESRGTRCPVEDTPFSSLPTTLQLAFVDCPGSNLFNQISCLRQLIETSDSLVHYGAVDTLCAKTFPLMKSTSLLQDPYVDGGIALTKADLVEPRSWAIKHYQTERSKPSKKKSSSWKTTVPSVRSSLKTPLPSSGSPHRRSSAPPSHAPIAAPTLEVSVNVTPEQTWIPTESPVLYIIETPTDKNARSKEQYSSESSFGPAVAVGASAIGTVVIGLLISKSVKRCRVQFGPVAKISEDPFLSGDASISSEHSQAFQHHEDEFIDAESGGRGLYSAIQKFQFFRKAKKHRIDPLEKSRATSHFQWTSHAIQSMDNPKENQSYSKLDTTFASATSITDKGMPEVNDTLSKESSLSHAKAQSNVEKSVSSPDTDSVYTASERADQKSTTDDENVSSGYFLDILAMDEAPESTITDSSEDGDPPRFSKSPKRRRFMFGRKERVDDLSGSPRRISSEDSQSVASLNREARHEEEALEAMDLNFSNNAKPWRSPAGSSNSLLSGSAIIRPDQIEATTPPSEVQESKNFLSTRQESMEESLCFLSPDMMKQFEDVDQCLSQGLKQLQEEDQKLTDGMDRLTASMSKPSDKRQEESTESFGDDCSNSSSIEWDGSPASQEFQTQKGSEPSSQSDGSSTISVNDEFGGIGGWAADVKSETAHEDDGDDDTDDEDMFEYGHLRNHFKSKWCDRDQYQAWKESRLDSSPPEQKKEAYIAASRSSLLPPRMPSEDEED